ncbi:hypothetical protein CoNPh26_CDS0102 [Staphylococcus phage S-CoN_Ph26]|nr:hypothetical protein CoNPh26_CDS0102 [Staphylococcus phage S-CoN_Ph26]
MKIARPFCVTAFYDCINVHSTFVTLRLFLHLHAFRCYLHAYKLVLS